MYIIVPITAGQSEDSDYTSEMSYPQQANQHNVPARQIRNTPMPDVRDHYYSEEYDPYDPHSFDRGMSFERGESFDHNDSFEHAESFDRYGTPDDYEREHTCTFEQDSFDQELSVEHEESDSVRDYRQDSQDYDSYKHDDYKPRTEYYQESPYHHGRSDTDSEPLSYNSRPPGRIKHHPYISEG